MARLLALAAAALVLVAIGASAAAQTPSAKAPPPPDFPAGVANKLIAVDSQFRGAKVTVFGVNPDRRGRGDIVVVLRGPMKDASIARKRRVLGLWVNADPVRFHNTASFLAIKSAKPLDEIATPGQRWRYELDPATAAVLAGVVPADADPGQYRRALVRLKRNAGLYIEDPRGLSLRSRGLFSAEFEIPANAPIGEYKAEVYLFRRNLEPQSTTSVVNVARSGLENRIHVLATKAPFFYGLAVVALAMAAGGLASLVMRRP